MAAVKSGGFIFQVGQEERSCPVEEEGPTEAARRASVFGQRPARGERPRPWFCPPPLVFCLCFFYFCMSLCFILTTLCLFSSSFLTLPDTPFVFFRLRLTLILAHSQHVECLFSELQLLRFLDYYWLSQSFKPCLKSVAVDVVCVWICGDCNLDADLCNFLSSVSLE